MLKLVYELLKESFSVTDNIIYNLIITGIIFEILNNFAYRCVGNLYRADIIESRFAGSVINFSIKIVILSFTIFILKISMFIKGIF